MKNRFSFFRLGCLALLSAASSPILLHGDQTRRTALEEANKSSEEYRKLFSTLLNPNGVDFEEFGSDSKAISVIGMFSDEKISGAELNVMHWINFNSPEDGSEGRFTGRPGEVKALNERAQAKREVLKENLEEERIQAEQRVLTHREKLERKLRLETEAELKALKEKNRRKVEEKLLREQQADLERMLDLEKKMQMQEEETQAIAELEAKLQKQEIESRKQEVFEKKTVKNLNEMRDLSQNRKKRINKKTSLEKSEEEMKTDFQEELDAQSEAPLFQGSLWRISPANSFHSSSKKTGMQLSGRDEYLPSGDFSSQEKSTILESLDKLERARALNRKPRFSQNSLRTEASIYPHWASGSKLLETAFDKCRIEDEYLVLAFSSHGTQIPKDLIIQDLQKYGISSNKIRSAVTFIECDSTRKNLDSKVEDLLVMSGIQDAPGYVVIELPGKAIKSTAKIVRACPLASRQLKSKAFSFRGNDR